MNGPNSVKYDASARADQQFIHDIVARRKLFFQVMFTCALYFSQETSIDRGWQKKVRLHALWGI